MAYISELEILELDSHVCVIKILFNLNSYGNEKFELSSQRDLRLAKFGK